MTDWRHKSRFLLTWPLGIKNTRTQELNIHSWHSFNDRVKPWIQVGRMWHPSDITPIFFTLKHEINRRCLLPGGRSHERWMRPFDIVVITCVWPWFDVREFDGGQSDWNELNRGIVRSKKQTGWDTVDHWHVRDDGLLSNDWLENKQKRLDYMWDVCDARMVSRPWNVCLQ